MSKFCENCPMKGLATEELEGMVKQQVNTDYIETGLFRGSSRPVVIDRRMGAALYDVKNNPSEPFWVGLNTPYSVFKSVEECEGPVETRRKRMVPFLKPEVEVFCPSIGKQAIAPSDGAYGVVARQTGLR